MPEEQKEKYRMDEKKALEKISSMPIVESFHGKSKDGRFYIHTTKFVDIKPISYINKVLESENKEEAK